MHHGFTNSMTELSSPPGLSTPHSLHLFTYSRNQGFWGDFGTQWFYGTFAEHWLDYHISVRKFLTIVLAMEMWEATLLNSSIVFHSGRSAVVHIISSNTS